MTSREKAAWEIAQDKGADAFEAGRPETDYTKEESHSYYWRQGWRGARSAKVAAFYDYLKFKDLHGKAYVPPQYRGESGYLESVQERRAKHIAEHEGRYRDFSAAYEKHLIWKKGGTA